MGEYHCGIAELYHKVGQLEKAELAYKKSIELKPHYVIAHINLGTMYRDGGRFGEAKKVWDQAFAVCQDPDLKQEIMRKLRGE